MSKHEKFLDFNGKKILFLSKDGTYWIAVKPICEALNIDTDRSIKTLKNDHILGPARSVQTVQVSKNGQIQGRKMTCIPEKYIYGWIFSLRSDSNELLEYKKTCYDLLFDHFHGTITNRKELLGEKRVVETEMFKLKQTLKDNDETFQKFQKLEKEKKSIEKKLKNSDNELMQEPEMF